MAGFLKFSDAAKIALHASAILASASGLRVTSRRLASRLAVSEAHLAKVMQRLARAGIVSSVRGPSGGFSLVRDGKETTLLDIFEAIEGPVRLDSCMLGKAVCGRERCFLGGLLDEVNAAVGRELGRTRLSEAVIGLEVGK